MGRRIHAAGLTWPWPALAILKYSRGDDRVSGSFRRPTPTNSGLRFRADLDACRALPTAAPPVPAIQGGGEAVVRPAEERPDEWRNAQPGKPALSWRQPPERREGLGANPDRARVVQDMQPLTHDFTIQAHEGQAVTGANVMPYMGIDGLGIFGACIEVSVGVGRYRIESRIQ